MRWQYASQEASISTPLSCSSSLDTRMIFEDSFWHPALQFQRSHHLHWLQCFRQQFTFFSGTVRG
jgi:hypothetical protein